MELSGLLVWAAVLVSLIAFIVFLVKSFKNWGVWMTICFVVLFIESWCFMVFTAGVNAKRLAAVKQHDALYLEVKNLLGQRDEEFYGKAIDPQADKSKFMYLANELNRLILERGRTWRGARVAVANPNTATVELPSQLANVSVEAPVGAPATPAVAPGSEALAVDSVVYAFGEDQTFAPREYIGEFKVTTVANNTVTMTPTSPMSPRQLAALNKSPTWSIYELMPLDDHRTFASAGSESTEEEIFGNMNQEEISKLLGIPLELANKEPNTLNVRQSAQARVLKSYLLDGARAPAGTPSESSQYEVEFLKEYTQPVDSGDKRPITQGGFFDQFGQAVDVRLMRPEGAAFSFKEGDKYRIEGYGAIELAEKGVVKLGNQYFVRPLNDYDFALKNTKQLYLQATQDALLIQREIDVVTTTASNTQEELLRSEEHGRRLEKDKSQYLKEQAVIAAEKERLESALASKKSEMGKIYSEIVELHSRLVKTN